MNGKNFMETFEQFLLMFCMLKKKTYILPIKTSFLSTVPNGEGWHYLAVKNLSALLREITSKHHCDFYCLICLHFFATKNKDESLKKICEKHFFVTLLCLLKTLKYYNLFKIKNLIKHHLLFMQILNA